MAKKQLNKMVTLPLLLAGVALLSAGVLTGVHLLTAPRIATNELNKKYEGYKRILEIDNFDRVEGLELTTALTSGGISLKQEFYVGTKSAGIVYDGEIKGWESGLIFQVGFKGNAYAGFNLISSNETPSIGADYLKLVNERIKGKLITDPILVDNDGTYTGATAPITAGALRTALALCAADFAGAEGDEETFLDQVNAAMNRTDISEYRELVVSITLSEAKVLHKFAVQKGSEDVGTVYEADIKGYKEGLHFLVGFSGDKYAGFKTISANETPGLGADLLLTINDQIKGVSVNDPILINTDMTNVTVTRTALKNVLTIIVADYLEGGN